MRCRTCNNELPELVDICPFCGAKISKKPNLQDIIFLCGLGVVFIASFLPYNGIIFNTPIGPHPHLDILWKSLNIWQIAIFVILLATGLITTIIGLIKHKSLRIFKIIVPTGLSILLALEYFLTSRAQVEVYDILVEGGYKEIGDTISSARGIGFYLIIFAIVICFVAALIDIIRSPKK